MLDESKNYTSSPELHTTACNNVYFEGEKGKSLHAYPLLLVIMLS